MSLLYPEKHKNAKIAPFKCCANGLPEFSHLLFDFCDIAGLQFILMRPYDSADLVL